MRFGVSMRVGRYARVRVNTRGVRASVGNHGVYASAGKNWGSSRRSVSASRSYESSSVTVKRPSYKEQLNAVKRPSYVDPRRHADHMRAALYAQIDEIVRESETIRRKIASEFSFSPPYDPYIAQLENAVSLRQRATINVIGSAGAHPKRRLAHFFPWRTRSQGAATATNTERGRKYAAPMIEPTWAHDHATPDGASLVFQPQLVKGCRTLLVTCLVAIGSLTAFELISGTAFSLMTATATFATMTLILLCAYLCDPVFQSKRAALREARRQRNVIREVAEEHTKWQRAGSELVNRCRHRMDVLCQEDANRGREVDLVKATGAKVLAAVDAYERQDKERERAEREYVQEVSVICRAAGVAVEVPQPFVDVDAIHRDERAKLRELRTSTSKRKTNTLNEITRRYSTRQREIKAELAGLEIKLPLTYIVADEFVHRSELGLRVEKEKLQTLEHVVNAFAFVSFRSYATAVLFGQRS